MRFLVTGSTGFIGRAVCTELAQRKHDVRRAARNLTGSDGGYFELGNIGPTTNWFGALEGVDALVHLAARVHIMREGAVNPSRIQFGKVNFAGTEHLARAAAASGAKRFVYVSSIGVNGAQTALGKPFSETDIPNPHNAYASSKWEAEQGLLRVADETGLEVVIIRPPLVYGPNAPGNFGSLMRAVQRGWPLPLGAVHNQRSLVALSNLVDFIVTCITHPQAANQSFLVSDGQDLSTTELVRGMAQAAGVPARLLPVPVWALQTGASLLGKGDAVQRLCGNLQIDISKARSLLDWVPPVSVEEGLRRAMAV
jgi:nucleoside-diphosphate-sugar epimerase